VEHKKPFSFGFLKGSEGCPFLLRKNDIIDVRKKL